MDESAVGDRASNRKRKEKRNKDIQDQILQQKELDKSKFSNGIHCC